MNISFSEQVMILACRLSTIEANLGSINKPHTFFQLLKNFLVTIKSKDPNTFHYDIARNALNYLNKEALKNEQAIDMLARELVRTCHMLDERLKTPTTFAKLICIDKEPNNPYLIIIELPNKFIEIEKLFFTSDGVSIWDNEYLKLLRSMGTTGIIQSNELSKKISASTKKWESNFWFKTDDLNDETHFFHSPTFLGLATVLWKDIVEKRVQTTQPF